MENHMNVKDFFLAINVEIDITVMTDGIYHAKGRSCETKDDCILKTEYGSGSTRKKALDDYAIKLSGKRLVVNAMGNNRREYDVPSLVPKPRATKKKRSRKKS